MPLILVAFYILLCLFVGFLGRYTRPGPWIIFILSLIFTPFVILLLMVVLDRKSVV